MNSCCWYGIQVRIFLNLWAEGFCQRALYPCGRAFTISRPLTLTEKKKDCVYHTIRGLEHFADSVCDTGPGFWCRTDLDLLAGVGGANLSMGRSDFGMRMRHGQGASKRTDRRCPRSTGIAETLEAGQRDL